MHFLLTVIHGRKTNVDVVAIADEELAVIEVDEVAEVAVTVVVVIMKTMAVTQTMDVAT